MSQTRFVPSKDSDFEEKLATVEGMPISRETVQEIPQEAGILPNQRRRATRDRSRGPRGPQEGITFGMAGFVGGLGPRDLRAV